MYMYFGAHEHAGGHRGQKHWISMELELRNSSPLQEQ